MGLKTGLHAFQFPWRTWRRMKVKPWSGWKQVIVEWPVYEASFGWKISYFNPVAFVRQHAACTVTTSQKTGSYQVSQVATQIILQAEVYLQQFAKSVTEDFQTKKSRIDTIVFSLDANRNSYISFYAETLLKISLPFPGSIFHHLVMRYTIPFTSAMWFLFIEVKPS